MNKFALKLSMLAATIALASCGSDGTEEAPAPAPALPFTTFQAADVAIGQDSLESNSGSVAPYVSGPYGAPAFDSNGKFYVPSYGNSTVYVYNSLPTTNGLPTPGLTLTSTSTLNPLGFDPETILVTESGKLLILDYSNSRILVWNTPPATNNTDPDYVIGNDEGGSCTPTAFRPEDIQIINGDLVVSDAGNSRVLIFDGIPTAANQQPSVASPKLVLGQPNFTTCVSPAVSAGSIGYPTSASSDGTNLVVVDNLNNRVLIWNDYSTLTNGKAADAVLGQPDMATSGFGITAAFRSPYYATFDTSSGRFAVADSFNNRVLIWESIPKCAAPAPSCSADFGSPVILGQTDGTKADPNGSVGGTTNAQGLEYPTSVKFNGPNQLIVGDRDNRRFVVFNAK